MNYELIGRKIVAKYPLLAKEIMDEFLTNPHFDDLSTITDIHARFSEIVPPYDTCSACTEYRLLFIAIIVKLYDPDYFYGFRRNIRCNLRKAFAELYQCNPTTISHNLKSVRNYNDVYPEFRYKVSYFYDTFVKEFKHYGSTKGQ